MDQSMRHSSHQPIVRKSATISVIQDQNIKGLSPAHSPQHADKSIASMVGNASLYSLQDSANGTHFHNAAVSR